MDFVNPRYLLHFNVKGSDQAQQDAVKSLLDSIVERQSCDG
ncbi:hypothetical protein TC41_2649 [Alicyclobacillus acidocaldarius subsp. acidocaldarius Tc-4-1]|uniref:Uncharacterized protein n=1 Tax=Alicyclobacillus acidocaldarius (strain Tc-4-1) TaxID=1048834 RepID=F8II64_ALIAT|nr:hypothetical protein TC41_2649 [Alicyclobacillus acidocaldarius subsp. acidocaldarius Tc-4-1]